MKLLVDTHTHTIASGHAYSTLRENALFARELGMEAFCCTDHGPALKDGAVDFILKVLAGAPEIIEGVRMFCGTEVNILDFNGSYDIPPRFMRFTDFAIASLHDIVIDPGTRTQNTDAMIGALNDPYIDVIGHPGNPYYDIDREAVVKEAKRLNKLIEINNHSFQFRKGSEVHCKDFIKLCMEHGVRITVSSDAHMCYRLGHFDRAAAVLEELRFPEELIVSRNMETFEGYLAERKNRLKG